MKFPNGILSRLSPKANPQWITVPIRYAQENYEIHVGTSDKTEETGAP